MSDKMSEALLHAQARFECIAEDFKAAGDTVSWAMCNVDAERMGKALAQATRPKTAGVENPVLWINLVGEQQFIRCWTADAARAAKFEAEGISMTPLYAAPPAAEQTTIPETCFDCGQREPCDEDCPNHVEPADPTLTPQDGGAADIEREARFLLDRLQEFDPGDFEAEREFHGHVAPSITRLSGLLAPKGAA